ncbi:hypothetical protein DFH11DRAFT_1547514 [Phellopilus nigrolimitatus]|nr:hypothetical protein DFH11DRAFT_1547514 [Phellopilus nigrolimitatus]
MSVCRTDEGRLESYMDKIAVWQLTASLDEFEGTGSSQGNAKADRHWTHVQSSDPRAVFPTSPFSDGEDSDVESVLDGGTGSRAGSRAHSLSRKPTPVPGDDGAPSLFRSCDRSLSVILAQGEASQRASASLVPETPVKRKRADSGSQGGPSQRSIFDAVRGHRAQPAAYKLKLPGDPSSSAKIPCHLPERAKTSSRISGSQYQPKASLKPGPPVNSKDDADADAWLDENADDSFIGSFGSPDMLVLDDGDEACILSSPSPTLKARGMKQSTRRLSMRRYRERLRAGGGDANKEEGLAQVRAGWRT